MTKVQFGACTQSVAQCGPRWVTFFVVLWTACLMTVLKISTVFRNYNRWLRWLKEIAAKATGNSRVLQKQGVHCAQMSRFPCSSQEHTLYSSLRKISVPEYLKVVLHWCIQDYLQGEALNLWDQACHTAGHIVLYREQSLLRPQSLG